MNITSHPQLLFYSSDNSNFKVVADHMTKTIESPISAQILGEYKITDWDTLIQGVSFPNELLALWVGYCGDRLFNSAEDVKYRFLTYQSYIQNAPEDVKNIARSIIHEIKTYADKYDIPSILLALAQNGGVCNVQKEVGLRMVYASMTDSMLQHITSESIETKILIMLRNLRETYAERTAEKFVRQKSWEMNTHYLIPIRNMFAPSIGLTVIKDPDQWGNYDNLNYLEEFMKLYTVDSIVKCLRIALNDSPRKLDYLNVLSFLEKHIPEDVDEYEFKQEFLFDISNGHFSDPGIRFMLTKMNIIRPKTESDEVETPVPVSIPVPPPPPPMPVAKKRPLIFKGDDDSEEVPWNFNLFDSEPITENIKGPTEERESLFDDELVIDSNRLEMLEKMTSMVSTVSEQPFNDIIQCIEIERPAAKKRDCIIL